jgi:hypothetical protein
MFIGHFGVGFGAKAAARNVSLGTLLLAAQFLDLLWPTLLLLGVETVEIRPGATVLTPLDFTSYPISHSLVMVLLWGLLFMMIYRLISKKSAAAIVVGLLVVSHWLLDLLVHRPDLPLYPGDSPHVGLGLWNMPVEAHILEGLIFGVGLFFYLRTTRSKNPVGRWSMWGLVVFLVGIHISNMIGPPPPSVTAVAWVSQLQWLIVLWGYWVDRNRRVVEQTQSGF